MPIFLMPLAFIAMVSLPALAVIYYLRSRHRHHVVSALFLWIDPHTPYEGGRRLQRLQFPLLFFLELLTLVALCLAAAAPVVRNTSVAHRIVVVLDDSYSMQAIHAGYSPRDRACRALVKLLRRQAPFSVQLLSAGMSDDLLGKRATTLHAVERQLNRWRCCAPGANLAQAIAAAGQIGGVSADVLVMTDHKPRQPPGAKAHLRWWAFGQAQANIAFVTAVRGIQAGRDRALLAIENFSTHPVHTILTVNSKASALSLQARAIRYIWLDLPANMSTVHASLPTGVLAIDKSVVLLPAQVKPLRTELRIVNQTLHRQIKRALQATAHVVWVSQKPQLLVTDLAATGEVSRYCWILRLMANSSGQAYIGPFIMNHSQPLARGISLAGVVWGAGGSNTIAGSPVISAGDVPLLTDWSAPLGGHLIRMRMAPSISTLAEAPALPVLMQNLVNWRLSHTPGMRQVNLALGQQAQLRLPVGTEDIVLHRADGSIQHLAVPEGLLRISAAQTGVYTITCRKQAAPAVPITYQFAVNALNSRESNLTGKASGRCGQWPKAAVFGNRVYKSIIWPLLLAAMGLLIIHSMLMSKRGRQADGL